MGVGEGDGVTTPAAWGVAGDEVAVADSAAVDRAVAVAWAEAAMPEGETPMTWRGCATRCAM